jgi:hypothetical protein
LEIHLQRFCTFQQYDNFPEKTWFLLSFRPRIVKEFLVMLSFIVTGCLGIKMILDDRFSNQYFFCVFLVLQVRKANIYIMTLTRCSLHNIHKTHDVNNCYKALRLHFEQDIYISKSQYLIVDAYQKTQHGIPRYETRRGGCNLTN